MTQVADKHKAGLMGPRHVRRLTAVEALLVDPVLMTDVAPALDWDFTDISGSPFTGNFLRSTIGGYRENAKGILVPTVANEPLIRFHNGVPVGTGFLRSYSNLVLWSEQFDNAAWTKGATTITPNASIAPDGTVTMDRVVPSTASTSHYIARTAATGVADNTLYTGSIFIKAAGYTKCLAQFRNKNGDYGNVVFDLVAKTAVPGGVVIPAHYSITELPNGIFYCTWTWSTGTGATVTTAGYEIFVLNASGTVTYAGDGTSGMDVWGAQVTQTGYPVPYVPTTTAAVTRDTDTLAIIGADFTEFYNPLEGTFFVEADASLDTATPSNQALFQVDDGSPANRLVFFRAPPTGGNAMWQVVVANANQAALSTPVISPGSAIKAAMTYKAGLFMSVVNNSAVVTDSAGSLPTVSILRIGNTSNGSAPLNSYVRRLIYWPEALDAATIKRMTAQ